MTYSLLSVSPRLGQLRDDHLLLSAWTASKHRGLPPAPSPCRSPGAGQHVCGRLHRGGRLMQQVDPSPGAAEDGSCPAMTQRLPDAATIPQFQGSDMSTHGPAPVRSGLRGRPEVAQSLEPVVPIMSEVVQCLEHVVPVISSKYIVWDHGFQGSCCLEPVVPRILVVLNQWFEGFHVFLVVRNMWF